MSTTQSFRRILLVDSDRNFQRLLTERFGIALAWPEDIRNIAR